MTATAGVSFTETMRGWIDFSAPASVPAARPHDAAQLSFRVTATIKDVETLMLDPMQRGCLDGTISNAQLGDRPLAVELGEWNVFVDTDEPGDVRHMRYRLVFRDQTGRLLTLLGHKVVSNTGLRHLCRDTTTLFTTVYRGSVTVGEAHDRNDQVLGRGVLRVPILAFGRQLLSVRGVGAKRRERWRGVRRFVRHFAATLREVYLPPRRIRRDDDWRRHDIAMFTTEGVTGADITTFPVTTADNLGLSMQRFHRRSTDDVVLLMHGLTSSTDMYIMPEHVNLVSHLLDDGFTDVWSFDWRGSNRHTYNLAPNDHSLDDVAAFDIPAAIEVMRRELGPERRIHVIAHCVGAISLMMSIAAGSATGLSSVIVNSVALTPRVSRWSRIKMSFFPWFMTWIYPHVYINPRWATPPWPGRHRGRLLARLISLGHRECREPACHMVSFMWGAGRPAAYLHKNLDDITHERLGDLFGGVTINWYRHIAKMIAAGTVVRKNPADSRYDGLLPAHYVNNLAHVQLPPTLFVSGADNRVFTDSNIVCHKRLKRLQPDGPHEFREFEDYGHQDVFIGKDCKADTFPVFTDFLSRQTAR